jgi:hypothetical protein
MNTNVKVKLDLTPEQAVKLKRAHKANRSVSIRLAHNQLFTNSGIDVELSAEQYKKVLSAYKSKAGRGVQLSFEANQVGGILPFLIPLLAGLAGVAARVAPVVAKAAAVGARVASTAAKVAPQIAKVAVKSAPAIAKTAGTVALTTGLEQGVGAIVNKIASDKAQAEIAKQNAMEASQQAQEGQGMRRGRKKQIASGLVPLGGRGLIPLGSQRSRGQGLMTYPSKKKAHRQ